MEDVLALYERPYEARFPVVCFDEKPKQLLGEVIKPAPAAPGGRARREDYEYRRNGTRNVLAAVEPLAGWRLEEVHEHRTALDFARYMNKLAKLPRFKEAEKIICVVDNLNLHDLGSFYACYPPEKARALAERFEFHYTPKKASWLNMAELELSVLGRQCLARRIGTITLIQREVKAHERKRNQAHATITWRFTTADARALWADQYAEVRQEARGRKAVSKNRKRNKV